MTKDEALKILKHHNLWRRNQDDVNPYEMCNPTELGKAIDYVVEALEQPAQEPVAYLKEVGGYGIIDFAHFDEDGAYPVYTHPNQWQGLTDDEIEYWECLKAPPVHPDFLEDDSWREFARCIEQALKEKNTS